MGTNPTTRATDDDNSAVRVWLVEDNQRLRRTLRLAIGGIDGIECTGDHESLESALQQLQQSAAPDVLLQPAADTTANDPKTQVPKAHFKKRFMGR